MIILQVYNRERKGMGLIYVVTINAICLLSDLPDAYVIV